MMLKRRIVASIARKYSDLRVTGDALHTAFAHRRVSRVSSPA